MDDKELEKAIIGFRRDLHRIPELDDDLPKTRDYLLACLGKLNCEIKDLGKAGFTAFFAAPNKGKNSSPSTIAFRADMDALPVTEALDIEFKSTHEGQMHACGHDGHMSILLGLALWINDNLDNIEANCLLVFQAAEETTGGAKRICDTGVLESYNASKIFGLHIWPEYKKNEVICRNKEFMASNFMITINMKGKSAHIAEYIKGIDVLDAGCKFIDESYALEAGLPKEVFRLLRFGEFKSGRTNNVVADTTLITGVMRAYSDEMAGYLWNGMRKIADRIESETGATIIMERADGYPPVINPSELFSETKAKLMRAGFEWLEPEKPFLQAEDFSNYQHVIPGLYMFLATGKSCKLHASDYEIDEDVLITGVRIFRTLFTE